MNATTRASRACLRLTLPALAVASLAACGGPSSGNAAVVPPTEVAAVQTPPPEYPLALACQGVGGTTTLKVAIGVEGKPTNVDLVGSSGNAALDESAQKVVRTWQFKPATRNGRPIPQSIQVPVKFTPPAERPNECFALDEQNRQG